jgi:hypothetical protein
MQQTNGQRTRLHPFPCRPSQAKSGRRTPFIRMVNSWRASSGLRVDLEAKEIRFAELYNSDDLVLPDECEFQRHVIMVQRIGFASKVEKAALHKGRVLRDVVAEILGYREQ